MVPVLLAIVTWSMICLGTSLYCAYFVKLIYCRQKIIYTSTLVEDLYYKKNPFAKYDKSFPQASIATLKDLALEQHRVSFLSGSTEIHQWNGHSSRFAYFVSSLWPWLLTAAGFTILSPLFSDFFFERFIPFISWSVARRGQNVISQSFMFTYRKMENIFIIWVKLL